MGAPARERSLGDAPLASATVFEVSGSCFSDLYFSRSDWVKLRGGSEVCNTVLECDLSTCFWLTSKCCVCDCEGRVGMELYPNLWTLNFYILPGHLENFSLHFLPF